MSILSKLFSSNQPKRLSKLDYWAKWELNALIDDIELAYQLISEINVDNRDPHLYYFIEGLELEIFDLTHDNVPDFSNVWHWFRSNGEWSQWTKGQNEELRERIYFRSNRWKTEGQD
ncbi:hypothetical protein [Reichenbachiella sp.]|uniref:hypothetical protein n=1 Tax=Reichenbachiella sp. TaxID=2184521 RepID=UPI00329A3B51